VPLGKIQLVSFSMHHNILLSISLKYGPINGTTPYHWLDKYPCFGTHTWCANLKFMSRGPLHNGYTTLKLWVPCSLMVLKDFRYVDVIWFIFHVLHLLPTIFTQHNSCCMSKSTMYHMQKPNKNSDFPWFSFGSWKCMFVNFLTWYASPPSLCSLWSV
jgi:hypothetical protein